MGQSSFDSSRPGKTTIPIRRSSTMVRSYVSSQWRTLLSGTILGAALMGLAAWVSGQPKPEDKNPIGTKFWPSEFGAEDQRGAANRITAEKTARAAELVKKGQTFQLGR